MGDEDLGEAATADNHPDDWKPKPTITEISKPGSRRPNVEVIIETMKGA